jgi:hypothetical protein
MKERWQPSLWGAGMTGVLAVLIVMGSRRLAHFDAALVGYTFAARFATFGITYRYCMWLQRPPTRRYGVRGWQLFLTPRYLGRNLVQLFHRLGVIFALNAFIWRRGFLRGAAHWLIMWGCIIAFAITFPLTFGWIHFQTESGNLGRYRAVLFGFPTMAFPIHSWIRFVIFHGLVWASFLVIAGVMLAMKRRMRGSLVKMR